MNQYSTSEILKMCDDAYQELMDTQEFGLEESLNLQLFIQFLLAKITNSGKDSEQV